MSRKNKSRIAAFATVLPVGPDPDMTVAWQPAPCYEFPRTPFTQQGSLRSSRVHVSYGDDWAESVPAAIQELALIVSQRRKQEFRINVLEIVVSELKASVQRLQSLQTKVVPIGTFAPEPYEVLRPILVSVHAVEGGYNACWFDANIHSSGDNDEEAVSNLKSLILDFVDSFAKEPTDKLGPESKRQLAVINQFVRKST